jgi:hypothetical protein
MHRLEWLFITRWQKGPRPSALPHNNRRNILKSFKIQQLAEMCEEGWFAW